MNSQVIYVLLVEDDIDYSALLRRRLMGSLNQSTEQNFVVAQTAFLHEAIEYAKANTVDAIVLDLNLPDALGMETLARMREAAPDAATIVLTGREDQELATNALKMGAQDYLWKGHFNTELLVRAIRYAIDRKQSEQALSQVEAKLRNIHNHPSSENGHSPAPAAESVPTSSPPTDTRSLNGASGASGASADPHEIATDFDTLLSRMAAQNSLALSQLGSDNPARVHVEKLHQTINLATDLTKRLFNGLRGGS